MTRRLFLGLELPPDTRAALADALDVALEHAPRARLSPPDNLHMTLVFLGQTDEGRLPEINAALRATAARTAGFDLTVGGAGTFGGRRPRVLWAGVAGDAERADALARELGERTGAPLTRPFNGHVTLARARGKNGDPALQKAAKALSEASFGPLPAREVVLFESRPSAGGVKYLPLCRESLVIRH